VSQPSILSSPAARRGGSGGGPAPDPPPAGRLVELARDLEVPLTLQAPLAPLTWLGIGGATPFLFKPRSAASIPPLLAGLAAAGMTPRWLGAGSNLLIDDRGIDDPVICTSELRAEPRLEADGSVRALGGVALPGFARWLAGRGLAGLEFAEGIPGSVGGSVAMNAGAFGRDLGERTARVVLAHPGGRIEEHPVAEGDFAYRRSRFATTGALVLEAVFKLEPGDPPELTRRLEEFRRHRRDTQPLSEQSAGCIFKNPAGGPSAGALIDSCGLKGLTHGAAAVSRLHANFVVNPGGAGFADVRALIDEVKARVEGRTGVLLEEEIRVWSRG